MVKLHNKGRHAAGEVTLSSPAPLPPSVQEDADQPLGGDSQSRKAVPQAGISPTEAMSRASTAGQTSLVGNAGFDTTSGSLSGGGGHAEESASLQHGHQSGPKPVDDDDDDDFDELAAADLAAGAEEVVLPPSLEAVVPPALQDLPQLHRGSSLPSSRASSLSKESRPSIHATRSMAELAGSLANNKSKEPPDGEELSEGKDPLPSLPSKVEAPSDASLVLVSSPKVANTSGTTPAFSTSAGPAIPESLKATQAPTFDLTAEPVRLAVGSLVAEKDHDSSSAAFIDTVAICEPGSRPPSKGSSLPSKGPRDNVSRKGSADREELPRWLLWYSSWVVRCPLCFFCWYLLLIGLVVLIFWRPFELESDLSSFSEADGRARRAFAAYEDAVDAKVTIEATGMSAAPLGSTRRLSHPGHSVNITNSPARKLDGIYYSIQAFALYYQTRNNYDILDARALREVRDVETRLRSLPDWRKFCVDLGYSSGMSWLCDPGESLATFAWAESSGESEIGFDLEFTGESTEMLDIDVLLTYMELWSSGSLGEMQPGAGDLDRYLSKTWVYGSDTVEAKSFAPTMLRSRFTFALAYGDASMDALAQVEAKKKIVKEWETFMKEQVYPVLSTASESTTYIDVFYTGSVLNDYDVNLALESDVMWALGSILFVTLYMGLNLGSIPAMLSAFVVIFASVPLAYVCTPASKATFATLMSLFLITVIDIDIIFMFNDFWSESSHVGQVHRRLAWMLLHAGKSCLATSLTTSLSFFANLLSAMQPLREFGMFMGLCVTNVYLLALLLIPPIFVVRHRRREARRRSPAKAKTGPAAVHDVAELDNLHSEQAVESSPEVWIKGSGRRIAAVLLSRTVDCTSTCPRSILLLVLAVLAACIYMSIQKIELDTSDPQIFGDDHNEVRRKEVSSHFGSVSALSASVYFPSLTLSLCEPNYMPLTETRTCQMYWCSLYSSEDKDEEATTTSSSSSTTECYFGDLVDYSTSESVSSYESCSKVHVRGRMVADNYNTSLYSSFRSQQETMVAAETGNLFSSIVSSGSLLSVGTLIDEDWSTGKTTIQHLYGLPTLTLSSSSSSTGHLTCSLSSVCFASGASRCSLPGWTETASARVLGSEAASPAPPSSSSSSSSSSSYVVPLLDKFNESALSVTSSFSPLSSTSSFSSSSRLQGSQLQVSVSSSPDARRLGYISPGSIIWGRQIQVSLLFGLWYPPSTPLVGAMETPWRFDPLFQPDNPWAQRSMLAACEDHTEDLAATWVDCWIMSFQQLVQHFPSRSFDDDFASVYSYLSDFSDYLWYVDGKLRACEMKYWADFSTSSSTSKVLAYQKKWDAYVASLNAAASVTANHVWHTSSTFVSAEATEAVISSTVSTIVTECLVSWIGILVFTRDPVLATIVLGMMLANTIVLLFFMTYLMEWTIGPIEIIFLVFFLGYSMTFGLHMAFNYSQITPSDPQLENMLEWESFREDRRGELRRKRFRPFSSRPLPIANGPNLPAIGEGGGEEGGGAVKHEELPAGASSEEQQPEARPGVEATEDAECEAQSPAAAKYLNADQNTNGVKEKESQAVGRFLLTNKELRLARTRLAVLRVGSAIWASTWSTVGSSVFLLMCQLAIFVRLGYVIIIVVSLSLLGTLFLMPAVLVLIGPSNDPCYKSRPRWFLIYIKLVLQGQHRNQRAGEKQDAPLLEEQEEQDMLQGDWS